MNRLITSIFVCLVAITASSHPNIAAVYMVTNCDNDNCEPYSHEMILVANSSKSLFYNKMSLYVDSCNSTPEGKAGLREIQFKAWRVVHPDGTVTFDGRKLGLAPEKKEYMYVAKNRMDGNLTVFDRYSEDLNRYSEPLDEMKWDVDADSVKTVLGYESVFAETDYHGRHWKVWFTPEIPVSEGPWKLRGLPGLILQADGGDGFIIEAKEAGITTQSVPEVYSVNEYEAGERRRLLADREHYHNNLEAMLAAEGIRLNGDGSSVDLPKYDRRKRAWETDY